MSDLSSWVNLFQFLLTLTETVCSFCLSGQAAIVRKPFIWLLLGDLVSEIFQNMLNEKLYGTLYFYASVDNLGLISRS